MNNIDKKHAPGKNRTARNTLNLLSVTIYKLTLGLSVTKMSSILGKKTSLEIIDKVDIGFLLKYIILPVLNIWAKHAEGTSNIPETGPAIIAPNHMSYLDHFLVAKFVVGERKRKVHILTKKEHTINPLHMLWYRLFFEKYITMIPIDRQMGRDGLRVAEEYLKNGCVLMIYPEGTRSLDGKLQSGKKGIGTLVRRTSSPVIPVGIKGTFEILPKGKFWPSNKKADIFFGEQLIFNVEPPQIITDTIMKRIAELSGQEIKIEG
jgi:1-acyl-sn-glycerol-3-phosphate acyltransferase